MSISVTFQKAQTITLDEVKILAVRDIFNEKKIIARIDKLPRGLVLWNGEREYSTAGNWTNETAQARAIEVLSGSNPIFV